MNKYEEYKKVANNYANASGLTQAELDYMYISFLSIADQSVKADTKYWIEFRDTAWIVLCEKGAYGCVT